MRKILSKKTIKRDRTLKFPYLLALLAYAAWGGWGYLLFFVPPSSTATKILFLTALFFGIFFTLTFLYYEVRRLINPGTLPSEALRVGGRRSLLISIFITLVGAMKLMDIANMLNLVLFGLILLLTEIQISRS